MQVSRLLKQTITLEPSTGQASPYAGSETYGPPVEVAADIENEFKKITNSAGKEVVASAVITLSPETTISAEDRLTLPDGEQPDIISIKTIKNKRTGQLHSYEVYVGTRRNV